MNLVRKSQRWGTFDLMMDWEDDLSRIWGRPLQKRSPWAVSIEPEVDLIEEKDSFMVKADLPGIKNI